MTFIFRNRTIFWDILKWNRGQKKWDAWSNNFQNNFAFKIIFALSLFELKLPLRHM